jgi:hypothetical protein
MGHSQRRTETLSDLNRPEGRNCLGFGNLPTFTDFIESVLQ